MRNFDVLMALEPRLELQARIQSLNQSIIHGGYAITDMPMINKRPARCRHQIHWYCCVHSTVNKSIADAYPRSERVQLNPTSLERRWNLSLWRPVPRKPEEEMFNKVVALARQNKWEETEQAATEVPIQTLSQLEMQVWVCHIALTYYRIG